MKTLALLAALLGCVAPVWGGDSRLVAGDKALGEVVRFIVGAQRTLDVEMYHMTDRRVMRALRTAAEKGVQVRIVLDPSQRRNLAVPGRLDHPRVEVRWMDTDESRGQLMHAKAACADHRWLLVGSANWTRTGLSASHEVGVLLDDAAMGRQFAEAFERLWSKARTRWPERSLRDEELMVLPDPGQYYEGRPKTKARKRAGEE